MVLDCCSVSVFAYIVPNAVFCIEVTPDNDVGEE